MVILLLTRWLPPLGVFVSLGMGLKLRNRAVTKLRAMGGAEEAGSASEVELGFATSPAVRTALEELDRLREEVAEQAALIEELRRGQQ